MGLRHATPLKFAPLGVCDSLDSTDNPPGAMALLTNLIPDPSTRNLFQCRPASILQTSFSSFTTPGFISCMKILGTQVYGLIATSRNAGKDEPFSYNLITGLFTAVGGTINGTTCPTSPSAIGAWTPPTMDLVGVNILVTHPGYNGSGGAYFGYFDITDPAAPTWNAGNLTGAITFTTTAPSSVKNFNGRAYWAVNPPAGQPALIFSDVLVPRNVTAGTQVLTFDDNLPLTALGALGVNTQLTGAVTQSLIVFKGTSGMFQITGDAATSNLAKNALNVPTGTLAPNSVCSTPKGLAFVSPEGVRIIDFSTTVSDPIGIAGSGITVPFTFAVTPSRMVAAAGGNILRVSCQNGNAVGTPNQEYWFDFARGLWTGPHSFPASLIVPYNNSFIMTPLGVTAKLFQSDTVQSGTSTYTENGNQLSFAYQTSMLPDTDQMAEYNMLETTLYMALVAGSGAISCRALDQDGTVLDTVAVSLTGSATVWGTFTWGQALWQGAAGALFPRQLPWTIPIVFRRMALSATGQSVSGFKIGRLHLRYEQLGYLQQVAS